MRRMRLLAVLVVLGGLVAAAGLVWFSAPRFPTPRPYSSGPALPAGAVKPKVQLDMGLGLVLAPDGSLWVFGGGQEGWGYQPAGRPWPTAVPRRFGAESDWIDIAGGGHHGVGIKRDGSLWVWGNGPVCYAATPKSGGAAVEFPLPQRVGMETDWVSVAAGAGHGVALRRDGSVWGWGQNAYGELGEGTTGGTRSVPVRALVEGCQRVAAGAFTVYAMRTNREIWAWGSSGANTTNLVPGPVGGPVTWRTFDAGAYHFAGIRDDGSLWMSGGNSHVVSANLKGPVPLLEPVQLGSATNWADVVCGGDVMFARQTDGTWWSFGSNPLGRSGAGVRSVGLDVTQDTVDDAGSQGRVAIEGSVLSADSDGDTSVFWARDGTLWCFGVRPGRNPPALPWTPFVEPYRRLAERLGLPDGFRPRNPPPVVWAAPRPLWVWPTGRASASTP